MYYVLKYGPIAYVTVWVGLMNLTLVAWLTLLPVIVMMGWGSVDMADTFFRRR